MAEVEEFNGSTMFGVRVKCLLQVLEGVGSGTRGISNMKLAFSLGEILTYEDAVLMREALSALLSSFRVRG